MENLNNWIIVTNDFIWTYILIALLICIGVYFTFKSRFVQFRNIREMFRLLSDGIASGNHKNSVSSFQAFCIATASRVGTGNLAGVATALALGGPGAIFWMWLIALIGSASAFIESTLAQIYKVKGDRSFIGGPAFYMEKGLKKRWLGILFAVIITITFGLVFNSVQANTVTLAFHEVFGTSRVWLGIILTLFTLLVIFGGIHRIAVISGIIVPLMAIAYILLAAFILFTHLGTLPHVIGSIFTNAFGFEQFASGGLGAVIMQGVRRGLFSNEAGMGSAPNAAATATVSHPVKQGLIQALSVFTDTLIICSCTALIILLSDVPLDGSVKVQLTQMALSHQIGSVGGQFIAICILLFAFSSIVGNYSYCETNLFFISKNKTYLQLYRIIVGGMVMFGSIAALDLVWNIADLFMAIMAITNLIAIVLLGKIALKALQDYNRQRRIRKKNIIFKSSFIPELKDSTSEWE